jgi:ABC-type multidrug transport system ATPase subunit
MLTGAYPPTSGYARIAGKDIRTQIQQIRQDIGICPQHNCLFPQLTVREHMQFFSRLKGLYGQMNFHEAEEHIDQGIRDVALSEKRHTLSKNLSGGMKRKLSVAIAFCGGSKTVLLDEPTSGMDPFSRRFTWNVIRQYRQDRCIILTTHYMDEADILGDRIAIMSHGQLQCVGSALFLKKTYGVGYQLTIEKYAMRGNNSNAASAENKNSVDQNEERAVDTTDVHETERTLREIVRNTVPEATLLTNSSTAMTYQMPMGAAAKFVPLFEGLDEEIERGNICSYGVGVTTLDEVFLAVARGDTTEKSEFASSMRLGSAVDRSKFRDDIGEKSVHSGMDLEEERLFFRHVKALCRKRTANFRRDKKAWLCTTILPSLFVLIGFLIVTLTERDFDSDPVELKLADYNKDFAGEPRNPIPFNNPDNPYTCQPVRCAFNFPVMDVTGTNETYYFCGGQTRIDPVDAWKSKSLTWKPDDLGNEKEAAFHSCSIAQSAMIMGRFTDDGAAGQPTDVDTVFKVNGSSRLWALFR